MYRNIVLHFQTENYYNLESQNVYRRTANITYIYDSWTAGVLLYHTWYTVFNVLFRGFAFLENKRISDNAYYVVTCPTHYVLYIIIVYKPNGTWLNLSFSLVPGQRANFIKSIRKRCTLQIRASGKCDLYNMSQWVKKYNSIP